MMAWFRRFSCLHPDFTRWHIAIEELYSSAFGTTRAEVQQRECITCGHIQRRKIKDQS
jgi:hypothetical protein